MTIEFHCPNCDKLLRTSDDKAGRRAKCPDCGTAVTVPQPSAPPADEFDDYGDEFGDAAGPDEEAFDRVPPRRVSSSAGDTKTCPVCGGTIKAAAVRCRHCGEDLGGAPQTAGGGPMEIDAGEVISTSWEIYKSQMGMLIGGMFLVGIINGAAGMPANVLGQLAENQNGNNEMAVLFLVLSFALSLVSWVVQIWLTAGHTIFMLKIARGEVVEIADIFRGGPFLLRALGNSLLFGLMVFLGILACIVPGIILSLMFWPFMYVLVDTDAPGIDCLARSKEITTNNWGAGFLLGLTSFGLGVLGFLACCVGLIFTAPLATFLFAVAYCRMTGQPTARV